MKPFFLGPLVLAMTVQPLALSRLPNATYDAAHKTVTTHEFGSRMVYALESPLRVIVGCHLIGSTLVRTQSGRTTMTHVSLGAHDIDPCSQ